MKHHNRQGSLLGEKVLLRPMTPEDTDRIVNWRNRDSVRKNFIYQKPFTPEGHRQWIETMITTGRAVQFIICEKETGRPIGSAYLRDIDREYEKAEYGIFIGEEEARGKGYGTETARLMLAYAFEVLKLHKICLRLIADNTEALQSYEKAGFVREAYLKDEIRINGIYRDIILMAKICER